MGAVVLVPSSSLPGLSLLLFLGNSAHSPLLVLIVLEKPPPLALPEHAGPDHLPSEPIHERLLGLVVLDCDLGVEAGAEEEDV